MKELSIEEKAQRYDEAVKVAKDSFTYPDYPGFIRADVVFPELKESEDELIGKEIINFINHRKAMGSITPEESKRAGSWIAWLEKQSEQSNNEDEAILHRFSFYSYKDEPNILYLAGLYVNDEYRNKGIGTKILKIADEVAVSMKCSSILLKTEIGSNAERLYKNNGYSVFRMEENQVWLEKQGEQKPADKEYTFKAIPRLLGMIPPTDRAKSYCQKLIDSLEQEGYSTDAKIVRECLKQMNGEKVAMATMDEQKQEWSEEEIETCAREAEDNNCIILAKHIRQLKSLRPQSIWKPSDEQMDALHYVTNFDYGGHKATLVSLYEQLKKLKDEK